MIIFKKASQLTDYIKKQKSTLEKVGFVPTMGALHQGHLSLMQTCIQENDISVCSIFVNPTQFNNAEDFKNYPITIEKDIEQLIKAKADVLFLPSLEEMYPPGFVKKHYELGPIENILEGFYRPGHFQGVCQVVDRLLEIVEPHNIYLGQKDFQQCMVINKLLTITGRDESRLHIVPTMREKDGLAMSSRNLRLNQDQRELATFIYQELQFIKDNLVTYPFDELKKIAETHLIQKGFQVDYVEIANADDLSTTNLDSAKIVALIAAFVGNIRLIDNLVLN